jgi:hypothetical protein
MKPKHKVLGKGRELILTPNQRDKLLEYTKGSGGYQELCGRVHHSIKTKSGHLVATVYQEDMARILEAAQNKDAGGWEGLFHDIMAVNP